MVPARNCRQLNCPVPIARRGGGFAEVALEAAFSYNCHGQIILGFDLPTTKFETLIIAMLWVEFHINCHGQTLF
ncbi:hypothetical protein SAMN02746065_10944 [Desulfocicer vacuolatum DSM 3385]|uniref:Uncharacterized protein n=1 Tax=Desulfocicer vacuolatum DSM 3385 TaxID=1121400 RepID=A0A1W2BPR8_9BACT|nr:hypothetical protein SAMN02746065_10944 [Desulfocicer vacuolatum DSM 3385]